MPNFNAFYYKDSYQKEFDSRVLSCEQKKDHYELVLENTAFYPEGGGQPSDHGTLNSVEVFDVQESDGWIRHYCREPLEIDQIVHGSIDWDRRFDFMQNHSGEHIVSGLIHQRFGYDNVGFHMGEVIQIDFNGTLSYEEAIEIEKLANEMIYANKEVEILYPSEEELVHIDYRSKKEIKGQTRLVKIEGADICACCGTHVKHTGEIGLIKVLSVQKHKGGTRVEIVSGKRALNIMERIYDQNRKISELLSAPPICTADYVSETLNNQKKLNYALNETKESLLLSKMNSLEEHQKLYVDFIQDYDRNIARKYANALIEKEIAETSAIINQINSTKEYIIISHSVNLRDCVKEINTQLNGRGGGSADIIQGSFNASEEEIKRVLSEILS